MKSRERAAITRVLIDLIKADKVIDSREIDLYRDLKARFSIERDDEISAYTMTLGQAIDILKESPSGLQSELMGIFEDMTVSDGFCAREEALLMLALNYCLRKNDLDCDVISMVLGESWFDEQQVLYVESHYHEAINQAIESDLRQITNELKLAGLYFVYLPKVIDHYVSTPQSVLSDIIGMLSPSLSKDGISDLMGRIKSLNTKTFCIEQLHHKLGFQELIDTPPALMFRIGQSKVGNNIYSNFLRVELTPDVVSIVQDLADTLLSFGSSNQIVISNKKDERGSFLYESLYRQIFEILLLQKAVTCHLMIDFVHGELRFPELDLTLKGLHRKEKALYTLFVYEAKNGGINFNAPVSPSAFHRYDTRMKCLQRRYAKIYAAFGGEAETAPDITKPEIRLPMISGIKKVITKQKEKIYDSNRFTIVRDKNGFYGLTAKPDVFLCNDFSGKNNVSIYESALFEGLEKIS